VHRLRSLVGAVPLRIKLWNGVAFNLSSERPRATVLVQGVGSLLRLLRRPTLCFGEAYSAGLVQVHGDLLEGLEAIFKRWRPLGSGPGPARRAGLALLRRARRRAQHHYDLGNAFYRLWLDEQMVYTCAYFESRALSLEQAQRAKMDYVCRKLRLRPGDRVLEAGCGWGALARHMALQYGARVTACNVSSEQIRYARQWAEREGFADRVRYLEDDFRNVNGRHDVFVSVGMLEHVGRDNYGELGRVIHERLDPGHGRGLLHFIGRNCPQPIDAWIGRRIFPGAYPPTLGEVLRCVLEPWDFSVLDAENLRLHYVRTLSHWRARFEKTADRAAAMFDDAFVRSWRLYLAASEAAFSTGWLQLFQVSFARGRDNQVPWTRAGLYREDALAEL
jgi:cyclopropane-fatty-acyl-phospholipid synthase